MAFYLYFNLCAGKAWHRKRFGCSEGCCHSTLLLVVCLWSNQGPSFYLYRKSFKLVKYTNLTSADWHFISFYFLYLLLSAWMITHFNDILIIVFLNHGFSQLLCALTLPMGKLVVRYVEVNHKVSSKLLRCLRFQTSCSDLTIIWFHNHVLPLG